MNIKNLVLLSLLACTSLHMEAASLNSLGYTGAKAALPVYKWALAQGTKDAAHAALNSGLSFTDPQRSALSNQVKNGTDAASTPVTPPVETGPTEAEKEAAQRAVQAAINAAQTAKTKAAQHEGAALGHKNDAVRFAGESKKAEAQAAATLAQQEANKAATEATNANDAAKDSGYNVSAVTNASAAQQSATNAETYAKAAQDAVNDIPAPEQPPVDKNPGSGDTTPTGTQHAEAIRLVQEIADKVNKTPYAGNLRDKLDNKAPVSGAAHRSKTLGRLGKDKVNKTYKKARVKTAYKDA